MVLFRTRRAGEKTKTGGLELKTLKKLYSKEKLNSNDLILSFVTEVSKFMQAGYTLKYY